MFVINQDSKDEISIDGAEMVKVSVFIECEVDASGDDGKKAVGWILGAKHL